MWQDWLFGLLKGIGWFFLNPVFYFAFLLAAYLGVSRVKKERKNFTVRAKNAYFELKQLVPPTVIIIGLCVSIVSIAIFLVVPMELIIYASAFTFLFALVGKTKWLSPVYTIGLGILLTMISLYLDWDFFLFSHQLIEDGTYIFPTAIILLGALIISEGILVRKNGVKGTSPRVEKSKRGQLIGVHLLERAWLLPVFLFIPSGDLVSPVTWWPSFSVGEQTYTLLLVPFLLGVKQKIQGEYPVFAINKVGKNTILLGIFITLGGVGSYYIPYVAIASVILAILGKIWIVSNQKRVEENHSFYFSRKNNGVMILGIVPDSPADKMELQVGEMISKVNSIPVQTKGQIYQALQKNSAHCKLEVYDINGEIRFVQRALFEGDHHELGLLVLPDNRVHGNEAV